MSIIRVLIYRLDIHNLQTKIVSLPDHVELIKKVVFNLTVYRNANTINTQVNHCPCSKYVMVIKRPNLHNLQTRKKHGK